MDTQNRYQRLAFSRMDTDAFFVSKDFYFHEWKLISFGDIKVKD